MRACAMSMLTKRSGRAQQMMPVLFVARVLRAFCSQSSSFMFACSGFTVLCTLFPKFQFCVRVFWFYSSLSKAQLLLD